MQVCVFFDDKLLRGNRAVKTQTHQLNAFQSPNCAPLVRAVQLLRPATAAERPLLAPTPRQHPTSQPPLRLALNASTTPPCLHYPVQGTLGVSLELNEALVRPQPKARFRVQRQLETSVTVVQLAPGFDDRMISAMAQAAAEQGGSNALVFML